MMNIALQHRPGSDDAPAERPVARSAPRAFGREPFEIALNVLRWRKTEIIQVALIAMVLAGFALLFIPATFTGRAEMLVETQRAPAAPSSDSRRVESPIDSAVLDSQLEIIRTDHIARIVLDRLQLWNDWELVNQTGLSTDKSAAVTIDERSTAGVLEQRQKRESAIIAAFKQSLRVVRYGRSYVAEISYTSRDPAKAAAIANAVAQAYIDEMFAAKAKSADRTSQWLVTRATALRDRAADAARSLEDFKSRNNLIVDASGKLSSERELDELSATLARARADTSQARARLELAQAVMATTVKLASTNEQGVPVIPDELTSPLVTRMRQQYLDLDRQRSDWVARQGADHSAAQALRQEMQRVAQSIADEVVRMSAAYSSDLKIAETREKAIAQRISEVFQLTAESRQNLVKMRELESEAQSLKLLYESALTRNMQTVDQGSYPVTDARIISLANVPPVKSSPRTGLTLLLAAMTGGLLGLARAARNEAMRPYVREAADIEREAGLPALGVIQTVPGRSLLPRRGGMPLLLRDPEDALRNAKAAVDELSARGRGRVVGVTSAETGDGKTTIAFNLALLLAGDGERVLLLDGNARNPTLSQALSRRTESLDGNDTDGLNLSQVVRHTEFGLDFLACHRADAAVHPSLVLGGLPFRDLVSQAQAKYDYVVIDLPKALALTDVRAASHVFDAVVLVAAWGRTSSSELARIAEGSRGLATRVAGVLLNKAPRTRVAGG